MEFEGSFRTPGCPGEVILRFTDIPRMASCMPGASIEGTDEDGQHIGVMTVAFGPKRIAFKGRMSCEFDLPGCCGVMRGHGAAAMRAARVAMETTFRVMADPDADRGVPMSIVSITSKAELGGVIAEFAKTGGAALAGVLIEEFARNLADEFAREEPSGAPGGVQPLSARKVIWAAIKQKLS